MWYRWVVAMFFAFSFVNSVIYSISHDELTVMLIYLSRWNLFGTAIASLLGAYLVTRSYFKTIKITNRMNVVLKFYWFLSNNSVVFACVVSSVYWIFLYPGGHNSLNNYLVHATNLIVLVIDLFIVRHPHRMTHFVFPMACGALYALFTIFYTIFGGVDRDGNNYVYPILDWNNKPQRSMIWGVGLMASLGISHVIVGGVHGIRSKTHEFFAKISGNKMRKHKLPIVKTNREHEQIFFI